MKNSLSLVVSLVVLGAFSSVGADELSDALKNGKVSGDIALTYEGRNVDRQVGAYYADTAYSVGSLGLNYE
ncbi:MAG: porin, partial [Bacilli bacterium]|nr:porin [Bacilli bacterium]